MNSGDRHTEKMGWVKSWTLPNREVWRTHARTEACMHPHTCTCTNVRTHTHTHIHTYAHVCTHTHTHPCMRTHRHTHMHTHTPMHVHMHVRVHTHTFRGTNCMCKISLGSCAGLTSQVLIKQQIRQLYQCLRDCILPHFTDQY